MPIASASAHCQRWCPLRVPVPIAGASAYCQCRCPTPKRRSVMNQDGHRRIEIWHIVTVIRKRANLISTYEEQTNGGSKDWRGRTGENFWGCPGRYRASIRTDCTRASESAFLQRFRISDGPSRSRLHEVCPLWQPGPR